MSRRTDLDDFLEGAGAATESAERFETLGLVGSLGGMVLIIGLAAFLLFVHRGDRAEQAGLAAWGAGLGAVVVAGALMEVWAIADTRSGSLRDLLVDGPATAAGFRLVGGLVALIGSGWILRSKVTNGVGRTSIAIGALAVAGLIGAVSFSFDGHTVTEGPRWLHVIADAVHVLAAGAWAGGVLALILLARRRRRRSASGIAVEVVRFSVVATGAVVAAGLAGVGMAAIILERLEELWTTPWGRTLLVKVGLVAVTAAIGGYNHFKVVPTLEADPADPGVGSLVVRTISAEGILLMGVIVASALLAGASTT